MGNTATWRRLIATVLCGGTLSLAQTPAPDWAKVGNSLLNFSLAAPSTGPINRVWYSPDGRTLYALTATGKSFETSDFETWKSSLAPPGLVQTSTAVAQFPEPGAQTRARTNRSSTIYAFGNFVYRSDDAGANWDNLTAFRSRSIIGSPRDLAVSPRDPNEIAVATHEGVYRSLDGGESWSGLNDTLPNFPASRFLTLPSGVQGVQLELREPGGAAGRIMEWQPGERQAWLPAFNLSAVVDRQYEATLQSQWGVNITAIRREGSAVYVGLSDGRIRVSTDGMASWQTASPPDNGSGPVEAIWVNPQDTRIAIAVLGAGSRQGSGALPLHVLRTSNWGSFWDNITTNLPDVAVHGVAASVTGAVYVASDLGVFYSPTGLKDAGGSLWQLLPGLPGPATDVRLDPGGNTLWAAVQGYGVYATPAPHRSAEPRVVSSADLQAHAAAPGSLMTVTGAQVTSARSGNLAVSVLHADSTESQIQIPFGVTGDTLALSVDTPSGVRALAPVPLETAAPVIFVDRDGSPIVFDADSGALIDAAHPAHARTRIQVMATGLGRVNPTWPAGEVAPETNPPTVAADVRVFLDGEPLDVTRKVLAPLYTGWNLVEVEIPRIVNAGPTELYVEADGHSSNHVRVYVEP